MADGADVPAAHAPPANLSDALSLKRPRAPDAVPPPRVRSLSISVAQPPRGATEKDRRELAAEFFTHKRVEPKGAPLGRKALGDLLMEFAAQHGELHPNHVAHSYAHIAHQYASDTPAPEGRPRRLSAAAGKVPAAVGSSRGSDELGKGAPSTDVLTPKHPKAPAVAVEERAAAAAVQAQQLRPLPPSLDGTEPALRPTVDEREAREMALTMSSVSSGVALSALETFCLCYEHILEWATQYSVLHAPVAPVETSAAPVSNGSPQPLRRCAGPTPPPPTPSQPQQLAAGRAQPLIPIEGRALPLERLLRGVQVAAKPPILLTRGASGGSDSNTPAAVGASSPLVPQPKRRQQTPQPPQPQQQPQQVTHPVASHSTVAATLVDLQARALSAGGDIYAESRFGPPLQPPRQMHRPQYTPVSYFGPPVCAYEKSAGEVAMLHSFLAANAFTRTLSRRERAEAVLRLQPREHQAGDVLMAEGEMPNDHSHFHLVEAG
ncbi:hypothetical protein T492DRAFT_846151 [Pavlovales sp. CCMP2436]|nr:hypothetical protein T492DRAFT_846151 [Pavlovales sp. CCMP2436]